MCLGGFSVCASCPCVCVLVCLVLWVLCVSVWVWGVLGVCLGVLGCDWVWLCSSVLGSCWVFPIWGINAIVLSCSWLKPFAAEDLACFCTSLIPEASMAHCSERVAHNPKVVSSIPGASQAVQNLLHKSPGCNLTFRPSQETGQ